jgi:hypothetical protein
VVVGDVRYCRSEYGEEDFDHSFSPLFPWLPSRGMPRYDSVCFDQIGCQVAVNVGDLVHLTISGADAQEVRATLKEVVPALASVISPTDTDARHIPHFDLFSLAMDFVVGTAAGLSVEGIRALIVDRLSRRRADLEPIEFRSATSENATGTANVTVVVMPGADGVIDITIQIS